MCGSGNMAIIFGAAVLACVVFVDLPTIGGVEITVIPVVANGDLQLADATFGFSRRNKGVDSVVLVAAYELKLEALLSVVRRAFIFAYCVVVVASNW